MEKFIINYKGKNIDVYKKVDGTFSADLPMRLQADGKVFFETIEREADKWKFTSRGTDECFTVSLYDDKRISFSDSDSMEEEFVDYRFDPKSMGNNHIDSTARTIYDVVKEIYSHEICGVSGYDILDLRKKKLDMALKQLGFSSPERVKYGLPDSGGYMSLRKIGKSLEDYRNLGFVYRDETSDGTEIYGFAIPAGTIVEDIKSKIEFSRQELADDERFIDVQDEMLYRTRNLDEGFCLDMKKKVSRDDWLVYSKVARKTAELYLGLNADLVTTGALKGIEDLTSLQGEELAERISQLIDSREFSEACSIEDRFVIRESEEFSTKIDDMGLDDPAVKHSAVGVALEAMKREALATRDKRMKDEENYQKLSKLYSAKQIEIKMPRMNGEEK